MKEILDYLEQFEKKSGIKCYEGFKKELANLCQRVDERISQLIISRDTWKNKHKVLKEKNQILENKYKRLKKNITGKSK